MFLLAVRKGGAGRIYVVADGVRVEIEARAGGPESLDEPAGYVDRRTWNCATPKVKRSSTHLPRRWRAVVRSGLSKPVFWNLPNRTSKAGLNRLIQRGLRQRLTVAPLLLFAAGHAKHDIPEAVARAAENYPGLCIRQSAALACHPALVELSARRYREAVDGRPRAADSDTLLVMVGRGSRDPEANSEMARFARLRWEANPVGWLETCYTAMTEPSLERTLEMAARLPFARVVIQPHLLFYGELLARIGRTARDFARHCPEKDWLLTAHLGPDLLLAEAVVSAAQAVEGDA